jgi:hypothetical protein
VKTTVKKKKTPGQLAAAARKGGQASKKYRPFIEVPTKFYGKMRERGER